MYMAQVDPLSTKFLVTLFYPGRVTLPVTVVMYD